MPDAEHLTSLDVKGGSLAELDNGREESAERYRASTRTVLHGRALAVVRSGTLQLTAYVEGLRSGTATVRPTPARSVATTPAAAFAPDYPAPMNSPIQKLVTPAARTRSPPRWQSPRRSHRGRADRQAGGGWRLSR